MTDHITIPRALLEHVQEFLHRVTHWRGCNHEGVTDLHDMKEAVKAALDQEPATAPEQPAWHDAPTCAGLWLCNYGILEVACINQPDVDNFDDFYNAGGRWYGPIPQDGEKS